MLRTAELVLQGPQGSRERDPGAWGGVVTGHTPSFGASRRTRPSETADQAPCSKTKETLKCPWLGWAGTRL